MKRNGGGSALGMKEPLHSCLVWTSFAILASMPGCAGYDRSVCEVQRLFLT